MTMLGFNVFTKGRRLPLVGLLDSWKPSEAIGLSVDDYDNVGPVLQAALFTDPTTPITITLTQFLALDGINEHYYIGSSVRGGAIFHKNTSRYILNKVMRHYGLVVSTIFDRYLNTVHYSNLENYV